MLQGFICPPLLFREALTPSAQSAIRSDQLHTTRSADRITSESSSRDYPRATSYSADGAVTIQPGSLLYLHSTAVFVPRTCFYFIYLMCRSDRPTVVPQLWLCLTV